jgi:hypothetical protein
LAGWTRKIPLRCFEHPKKRFSLPVADLSAESVEQLRLVDEKLNHRKGASVIGIFPRAHGRCGRYRPRTDGSIQTIGVFPKVTLGNARKKREQVRKQLEALPEVPSQCPR